MTETTTQPAPTTAGPLGSEVESPTYRPDPVVIGRIEESGVGNTVLRIGEYRRAEGAWSQTGLVVLTPAEREQLIAELIAHRDTVTQPGESTVIAVLDLNDNASCDTAPDGIPAEHWHQIVSAAATGRVTGSVGAKAIVVDDDSTEIEYGISFRTKVSDDSYRIRSTTPVGDITRRVLS